MRNAEWAAQRTFWPGRQRPGRCPPIAGLTVGPNIDYVLVKTFNPYTHEPCNVILAKALVGKWFKAEGENGDFDAYAANGYVPASEEHGQQGRGETITRSHEDAPTAAANPKTQTPAAKGPCPGKSSQSSKAVTWKAFAMNSCCPLRQIKKGLSGGDPLRVVLGDFVTTEDGTGIVHTAPAFGADDFKVGQKTGLGIFTLVDKQGKFVDGMDNFEEAFHLSGKFVKNYRSDSDWKDMDLEIALYLKANGKAFKRGKVRAYLPALLAHGQAHHLLSAGCVVYPHHCCQGPDDGAEQDHQLEA